MSDFFYFLLQQKEKLLEQTLEHIGLTFISLLIALLLGVPLGIWIARNKRWSAMILGFAGVMQTVPSIALLGFMIPLLGIGSQPAIAALFLYALLPIIRNTFTGIQGVSPSVKEAAQGMGMTSWQQLFKIELPLALPVIFAGIRTATVINVGVATLAAYIAAGGLGEFIFGGIALNNPNMILAGAIPAALLAILFDSLLAKVQRMDLRQVRSTLWLMLVAMPILSGFYLLPNIYGGSFQAGFAHEFLGRSDGYPMLKETYKLQLNTVSLNNSLMYEAVKNGEVDLISGYSTDGRIKAYQLQVLKDDKKAFPPYYAAPLIRQETASKYPEVIAALELLSGKINDSVMTELNYQVDYLKRAPKEVARQFLQTLALPETSPLLSHTVTITIGSKIFTEQYILSELFGQLIRHSTGYQVVHKTGLGGTKICFDALLAGEIDLYPEYTGTGLIVMLQPDTQTLESLNGDKVKIYQYVKEQFDQNYQLSWLSPLGFNNTYALMMRKAQAQSIGIETISELKTYLSK
ncbi:ABC transporter permease/substrate-binding protein [Rapidithrix thailandica]|uniref:ABC transporter permease/substrate-binding protein n=1 Tax=Rapidithrix thailandica TaxID=413964 RepID=A0AAW9S5I9_9BACT